jgi:NAD(P)-dependent dehydrogenase (short-subunit alcohol dehydrogenase family)
MAKKVFITGSNKGIGKQIARQMGKNGWAVLIGSRNEKRGIETVDELKGKGLKRNI